MRLFSDLHAPGGHVEQAQGQLDASLAGLLANDDEPGRMVVSAIGNTEAQALTVLDADTVAIVLRPACGIEILAGLVQV